jgi:hypothetical protein
MDDLSSNIVQANVLLLRHNQFQYVALKQLLAALMLLQSIVQILSQVCPFKVRSMPK